jgi:hypothetical protein
MALCDSVGEEKARSSETRSSTMVWISCLLLRMGLIYLCVSDWTFKNDTQLHHDSAFQVLGGCESSTATLTSNPSLLSLLACRKMTCWRSVCCSRLVPSKGPLPRCDSGPSETFDKRKHGARFPYIFWLIYLTPKIWSNTTR